MSTTYQRTAKLGGAIARAGVSVAGVAADAATIIGASMLTGTIYHQITYGDQGQFGNFVNIGFAAAILFVSASIFRGEYAIANYFSFRTHAGATFQLWNVTILSLLALGFLAKVTEMYSRGSLILFYLVTPPGIVLMRYTLVHSVLVGTRIGLLSTRRVFLVGNAGHIEEFIRRYQPWNFGLTVVGTAVVSDDTRECTEHDGLDARGRELKSAAKAARMMRPDAVFILAPWSDTAMIDACVEAFLAVPVELHLGPERILDRFDKVRIFKHGSIATLQLTCAPLYTFELLVKRMFDIVLASAALVLLFPLLACVAVLIRLDSPGPVFFFQRRYGFNQRPFHIIKFRTMTTLDDGDVVVQARRNDPRLTRVGRWLRRRNIDELPQLFNVIRGDMSLVGPRPHALAHDRAYEQRIALYARRHNVLPGITGWAQVNGCRGETDTDEKMQRRLAYDFQYIDNWSLLFDLWILLLTVFSRRAYENAR
jgi:Undecaprenyl-phosphate glucose phosphotransferase